MKVHSQRAIALGLAALIATALAMNISTTASAQRRARATVALHVEGMHCATCPITVRVALERLEGVETVRVSLEGARAIVTYDPRRVSPARMITAIGDAGYRASLETSS